MRFPCVDVTASLSFGAVLSNTPNLYTDFLLFELSYSCILAACFVATSIIHVPPALCIHLLFDYFIIRYMASFAPPIVVYVTWDILVHVLLLDFHCDFKLSSHKDMFDT